MDRRSFLKFFGIGAAAVAIAPKLLAKDDSSRVFPDKMILEMKRRADSIGIPSAGAYIYGRALYDIHPGDLLFSGKWGFIPFMKERTPGISLSRPLVAVGISNVSRGNWGFFRLMTENYK